MDMILYVCIPLQISTQDLCAFDRREREHRSKSCIHFRKGSRLGRKGQEDKDEHWQRKWIADFRASFSRAKRGDTEGIYNTKLFLTLIVRKPVHSPYSIDLEPRTCVQRFRETFGIVWKFPVVYWRGDQHGDKHRCWKVPLKPFDN